MTPSLTRIVILTVAAALAIATFDGAWAARKKSRAKPPETSTIQRDYDGTPIIMKGFRRPKPGVSPEQVEPTERVERPVRIPRGSSTYIPPPVPSPGAGPTPQDIMRSQTVQPYNPPPINTFSDRVRDAIHAYPLEKGLGNNPIDQQMFIRQRANQ